MIKLIYPSKELEKKAKEFKQTFYDNNEKTIYGSYKFDVDKYSYDEWLKIIEDNKKEETANPKFGVSDTFFVLNEENEIVGIVNIRYSLTDFYKDKGNIGYSVSPKYRKQGYAKEILKEALKKTKDHGLKETKVVCEASNIPSKKTILASGGKLHRIINDNDENEEEYIFN